jgi:hypothetical protein
MRRSRRFRMAAIVWPCASRPPDFAAALVPAFAVSLERNSNATASALTVHDSRCGRPAERRLAGSVTHSPGRSRRAPVRFRRRHGGARTREWRCDAGYSPCVAGSAIVPGPSALRGVRISRALAPAAGAGVGATLRPAAVRVGAGAAVRAVRAVRAARHGLAVVPPDADADDTEYARPARAVSVTNRLRCADAASRCWPTDNPTHDTSVTATAIAVCSACVLRVDCSAPLAAAAIGAPHLRHAAASVETSVLHSGHAVIARSGPPARVRSPASDAGLGRTAASRGRVGPSGRDPYTTIGWLHAARRRSRRPRRRDPPNGVCVRRCPARWVAANAVAPPGRTTRDRGAGLRGPRRPGNRRASVRMGSRSSDTSTWLNGAAHELRRPLMLRCADATDDPAMSGLFSFARVRRRKNALRG